MASSGELVAALEAKNHKLRQALEVSMHNQTALAERYNAMLRDYETQLSEARINQTLRQANVETYIAFVGEIDAELSETGRTLLLGRWPHEPIERLQRTELMAELKRLRLVARGPGSPRMASPLKRLDRSPSSRRALKPGSGRIRKPITSVVSPDEAPSPPPILPAAEPTANSAPPSLADGWAHGEQGPTEKPMPMPMVELNDSPRPERLSPDGFGEKVSFEDNLEADEGGDTKRNADREPLQEQIGATGNPNSLNASVRSTGKQRDKRGSTADGVLAGNPTRPSPPSIRRSRSIRPQRLVLVSYSDDVKHTVFTQEAKISELTQHLDRLTKKFRLVEQEQKETRDLLKRQERDLKDIVMSGLRRSAALLSRERDIRSGEGRSTSPVNQLAFYSQGEEGSPLLDSGKQPDVPLGRGLEVTPPAVLPSLPPSSTFRVGRSAQSASRPRTVGGQQRPPIRTLALSADGVHQTADSAASGIPMGWFFTFSSDLARLLLEFTKAKDYLEDLHRDLLQFATPPAPSSNGVAPMSKQEHPGLDTVTSLSAAFGDHTCSSSSFVSGVPANAVVQQRKQFLQQIIDFDSPNLRLLVDPYLSLEPAFRSVVLQSGKSTVSTSLGVSSPLHRGGGRPSDDSLQALQLMEEVWRTLNGFLVGHLEHLVVLIGGAMKR
jgi:hypothetical protein